MSAVVIIPTTGSKEVIRAIKSVTEQTYDTKCYVVCDGPEASKRFGKKSPRDKFELCHLPENVGANGFYGHRVYAAFSHLVNEDYVFFLDQDCWFDPGHVKTCIDLIKEKELDWCYSLRKICDKEGNFLCEDNCESLGAWVAWTRTHHIDTNTYCLRRDVLIRIAAAWHGGWGQDRVFYKGLEQHFKKYDCTREHTVNYCLAGNPGSVTEDFFEQGNKFMMDHYKGDLPWKRKV